MGQEGAVPCGPASGPPEPSVAGGPQRVIEKAPSFRGYAGGVQRILVALEIGGVPLETTLERSNPE